MIPREAAAAWVFQEAGWYTKHEVGGVVRERGGWWYWPVLRLVPERGEKVGPFTSMKDAMKEADRA